MDLALNNLQRLICHKTQQTKPNHYHTILADLPNASRAYLVFAPNGCLKLIA